MLHPVLRPMQYQPTIAPARWLSLFAGEQRRMFVLVAAADEIFERAPLDNVSSARKSGGFEFTALLPSRSRKR